MSGLAAFALLLAASGQEAPPPQIVELYGAMFTTRGLDFETGCFNDAEKGRIDAIHARFRRVEAAVTARYGHIEAPFINWGGVRPPRHPCDDAAEHREIEAYDARVSALETASKRQAPTGPAEPIDAFRTDAEAVYRLVYPICGSTSDPALLERYQPQSERLTALETLAAGTPLQGILAEAKRHRDVIASEVDCAAPVETPGTHAEIVQGLAKAAEMLSRMDRTISLYTPKEG